MFRYLVFAHDWYYPSGAMDDCQFKTNSVSESLEYAKELEEQYAVVEIYDTKLDHLFAYKNGKLIRGCLK